MPEPKEIQRTDLPEMYQQAGDASAQSQKLFFRWNLVNLLVLTAAAALTALKTWLQKPGAVVAVFLLALGAILSFWLRQSKYERRWYSARAVAESVKTLSWRYMMCASPFEGGSEAADDRASAQFNKALHEIADQEEAPVSKLDEITPKMRQVRQRPSSGRLALYLRERVEDQRSWYARNSAKSSKAGDRYLLLAAVAQIIALCFALLLVFFDKFPDVVGVFATVSAGYLAWLQLKKYEDLAQAYKTAAKELVKVADAATAVHTDTDLSQFVIDAENAMSREHTLWLAKRS